MSTVPQDAPSAMDVAEKIFKTVRAFLREKDVESLREDGLGELMPKLAVSAYKPADMVVIQVSSYRLVSKVCMV